LNTFESAGSSISLIDVRKKSKYVLGHLPLARQVYRPSIQREDLPYEGAAISRLKFELLLDSLGVKPNDWIVAYDDKGGSDAARFCWLARLYGHSKATVLDGGLNYYALSNTLDTNDVKIKHSGYKYPDSPQNHYIISTEELQLALEDSSIVLLDTRSLDEYSGARMQSGASRPGHIPGSILFDWGNCVQMDSDYLLKSPKFIQYMLKELGISPEDKVITYCHTGVRSSHTMSVLRDHLGYTNVRNYDGSWCEWSFRSELPVETDVLLLED
jgi:thiosulfate/3-mercaptopyruvate sulfurtransferase